MKLQIKYNVTEIDSALTLAHETKEFADILEVGQLLILKYGLQAIKAFCKEFPDKKIYVDAKLSERPEESIAILAGVGVHYVSILAGAYHSIIRKACEAGAKEKILVVVDFINTTMLGQSAMVAQTLGAHAILIHRESILDEEANDLENDWQQVRDNTDLPIFIQGKISPENIDSIITLRPQVIIVGDGITRSKNPAQEAAAIKKILAKETIQSPRL
jgi:3-keto-L-gulonate-6-phosphate decarboxylase